MELIVPGIRSDMEIPSVCFVPPILCNDHVAGQFVFVCLLKQNRERATLG